MKIFMCRSASFLQIDVGNVSVLDVTFFEDLPCNGGQLTLTGVKEISLLKAF